MRPVYACSLRFPGTVAGTQIWHEVALWIESWYGRQAPEVRLPPSWQDATGDQAVSKERHTLACETLTVEGDSAGPQRRIRWNYPDANDPTLVWSTEVAVHVDGDTFFSLTLKIASADYEVLPPRFLLGTPRIVRTLVARGDAFVGTHRIEPDVIKLEPTDVDDFVEFLRSKTRRHPVVVLSVDPYREAYSVDPKEIVKAVAGLASVYALASKWAGFALTDELGKPYSCFNGAVRIYWPRFGEEEDPYFHRLWLPGDISALGSAKLGNNLLRTLAAAASFRFAEPEPVRRFQIRYDEQRLAALKASKGGDYDQLFEEYAALDGVVQELRQKNEELLKENENHRANQAASWAGVPEIAPLQPAEPPSDERPELETVSEAVEEAQKHCRHLVFLDEAFSSAAASPFKQPSKVYSALMAIEDLARRWADQLSGGAKLGSRRDAFRNLGFEYKEDISQTSEARWGDEYSYIYDGRKTLFAPHITIGAKQADKCLSIHMHWDERKRRVVIAHVGRHKTNTRA